MAETNLSSESGKDYHVKYRKDESNSLFGIISTPFKIIDVFMDSIPLIGDLWNYIVHGKKTDIKTTPKDYEGFLSRHNRHEKK